MPGRFRRLRVSLRTVLIGTACLAFAFAWFAHYARTRTAALASIRAVGGKIEMEAHAPTQLERWFGAELFGSVNGIDLRKCEVDNGLLAQVAVLKETCHLDLSYAEIDDSGVALITHLPLRELWLQNTKITDASGAILSRVGTLTFLQVNATALTDEFLKQLAPLPALEDLGLRGTRVTGSGMTYLSRHPRLKELDVYSTDVDDRGVEQLTDCRSLTHAGLSMTQVTDDVFQHLGKLPRLASADLSGNRMVTTEAVLAFEKKHPQCNIEWYGK